jgi:hypothetical protein
VSFSTFLCLLFLSILFRNPFFIFIHLDKQHPSWLEKLPMSAELTELLTFLFLNCPRVRPCECGCIHEDLQFPIPTWWIRLIFCEWSTCGCLAVFPRLKGRSNVSLFSLWWLSVGDVDYKSLHSFLSQAFDCATVFSCRFCWLSQESLNNLFAEKLEVRLVLYLTTLSVDKKTNSKYFNLNYFKQSETRKCSDQVGTCPSSLEE